MQKRKIKLRKAYPDNIPRQGDKFKFKNLEWVALGIEQGGLLCISADTLPSLLSFDTEGCANWEKSTIRKYLNNEFLASIGGKDNLLVFESDLMPNTSKDSVFLISEVLYRKYQSLIPKYQFWWWTITPETYDTPTLYEGLVGTNGRWMYMCAKYAYGVVPCICINLSSFKKEKLQTTYFDIVPRQGEHIQFCGQDWVVLGVEQGGLLVIKAEPLPEEMPFDKDGIADWRKSSLRKYLNGEYLDSLGCADDALIEFESDLTADDGSKNYGTCKDKVFLLSDVLYRKYREYIPKYDCWWWTITPWSPSYACERLVSSSGTLLSYSPYNSFSLCPSLCLNLSSLPKLRER